MLLSSIVRSLSSLSSSLASALLNRLSLTVPAVEAKDTDLLQLPLASGKLAESSLPGLELFFFAGGEVPYEANLSVMLCA